jgi:hypothetical protein
LIFHCVENSRVTALGSVILSGRNNTFGPRLQNFQSVPTYSYITWPLSLLSVGVAMMQPCDTQQKRRRKPGATSTFEASLPS